MKELRSGRPWRRAIVVETSESFSRRPGFSSDSRSAATLPAIPRTLATAETPEAKHSAARARERRGEGIGVVEFFLVLSEKRGE